MSEIVQYKPAIPFFPAELFQGNYAVHKSVLWNASFPRPGAVPSNVETFDQFDHLASTLGMPNKHMNERIVDFGCLRAG